MPRHRPSPAALITAIAAAIGLAACGGGTPASAGPPPPPPPPPVSPGTVLADAGLSGAWFFAGASNPDLPEPLDSRVLIDSAAGTSWLSWRQRSDGVGPDTWLQDHLASTQVVQTAALQAGVVTITSRALDAGGLATGPGLTHEVRVVAGELQVALPFDGHAFTTYLRFTRARPELPPEALAPERYAYAGPGFWPDRTTSTAPTIRGAVTLSVGMPAAPTQVALDSVARGVEDISIYLTHLVGWFGSYPSSTLYVDVDLPTPEASGMPGGLHIGTSKPDLGQFGIDDPWLVGHELTHSYFSSRGMYSWMAEGMACFLPVVMRYDAVQTGRPPWFGANRVSGDPTDEAGLLALIQSGSIDLMVPQLAAAGFTLDTPLPLVEADYAAGSNLGRAFFATLYLKLGRQAFFRAMRDVYALHRNNTRPVDLVTYQDLHDLVIAQTPASRLADVQPWLRAKLGLP